MLDAFGKGTSEKIAAAKALLYDHLTQAREPSDQSPTWSHSDWRMEHEANRDGGRARRASIHEGSDVGRLPPNSVALLHRLALQLNELVARLEALEASEENPNGTLPASGRTTRAMSELAAEARAEAPSSPQGAGASGFGGVPANGNACNEGAMASGSPTRGPPITSSGGESGGLLGDYDRSRKVESLLLVSTRWSKLCYDFFSEKKCAFNLSKVPDIFDMARYDLMHNNDLDEEFVEVLSRVLATVEVLAACVIPHEYGVTPEQKLSIGSDIAKVLLGKLLADMLNTRDESMAATPESAERERDFENPLAALLGSRGVLGSSPGSRGGAAGGGRDTSECPDSPARSCSRVGSSSRPCVAAEDEEVECEGCEPGENSSEEDSAPDHRLNVKYAVNISTPARHVRSRIYFTSESHVHALVNVLRFATNEDGQPLLKQEARQILEQTDQLDYLTHIVFRLFEDMNAPRESAARFRLQVLFSPGAAGFDVGGEQQKLRPVEPLIELPLEYLAEDEGFFFRSATSLDDFVKLTSPHQKPWPRKMRNKQTQRGMQASPFKEARWAGAANKKNPARAFILEPFFAKAPGSVV
jgi:inositol hexakisphosphate/diphosphoinositol-pentakisphosphate kinase